MKLLRCMLLTPLALTVSQATLAQTNDYPNRPIRWIIPFPPGGSNDILGRFFGNKLTEQLGQHFVIDNRGGANGSIGTDMVAKSPPDGHTILMISTSYVLNATVRKLPYDIVKSFDPVSMIGSSPNSIVVNPGAGIGSIRELVERAKAKPGALSYASTGVGGFNHFGGELFKKLTGVDMVHVPYKGGGPAMIDIMAGQIPVMFTSVTQVLPHVRTGKIRMLAIGANQRSPVLPDIPTVAESGYPGYAVAVWWGISMPAGVPGAIKDKLAGAMNVVLKQPDVQKFLANEAATMRIMTPVEFHKYIGEEYARWSAIAQQAGIRVQ